MKKNKLLLIGGGSALLLLAILFGAFFTIPLLASARSSQTNANAASTPAAATPTPNPYCQRYFQDLAKRLGVPVSTLQRDMLAAADDTLAQLVKDGRLTQKQANAIKQFLQSHQACTGISPVERGIILQSLKPYLNTVANQVALGLRMTPSQLKAQLQAGKRLSQLAAAQGVSSSQLQTTEANAVQSAVNQAVHNGDLTQQQATTFMQYVRKHPEVVNRIIEKYYGRTSSSNQ
jgi:polyhydroxyalkanoate synthesis regulator phasin